MVLDQGKIKERNANNIMALQGRKKGTDFQKR
jgi:hypothetical protein